MKTFLETFHLPSWFLDNCHSEFYHLSWESEAELPYSIWHLPLRRISILILGHFTYRKIVITKRLLRGSKNKKWIRTSNLPHQQIMCRSIKNQRINDDKLKTQFSWPQSDAPKFSNESNIESAKKIQHIMCR